jgi:hypothetical protein
LKREKINGKWRYYYDAGELESKYGARARGAELQAKSAVKRTGMSYDESSSASKNYDKYRKSAPRTLYGEDATRSGVARTKVGRAKRAKREYEARKIASFPRRAAAKGMAMLLNVLSGGKATSKRYNQTKKKPSRTKVTVSSSFSGYR